MSEKPSALLAKALKKARTWRALEQALGIPHTTMMGWMAREDWSAEGLIKVVEYLGGNFQRALPEGWDPYTEANEHYKAKAKRLEDELRFASEREKKLLASLRKIAQLAKGADVIEVKGPDLRKVADGGSHSPKDKPP